MTHGEMGEDRKRVRGRGWLGKRVEGGKEKEKVTKQEEKEGASYKGEGNREEGENGERGKREEKRGSVMERDTEMEGLTETMKKISGGRGREREEGVEKRLRGCQEVGR